MVVRHFCTLSSNPEAIKVLLEAGADANVRDIDGYTPLIQAVGRAGRFRQHRSGAWKYSDNGSVVKALLRAGADVNARARSGGDDSTYEGSFKRQS